MAINIVMAALHKVLQLTDGRIVDAPGADPGFCKGGITILPAVSMHISQNHVQADPGGVRNERAKRTTITRGVWGGRKIQNFKSSEVVYGAVSAEELRRPVETEIKHYRQN